MEFIETREYQTDDHLVQYYYVTRYVVIMVQYTVHSIVHFHGSAE